MIKRLLLTITCITFPLYIVCSQQNIKLGFESCEQSFNYQTLWPMFGKSFVKEHFKMDSINSYFNYIDYKTNESYLKVGIESSDTITSIPTQYALILSIVDNNQEIGSVKVDCHYQDNVIKADKWKGLKDYIEPQLKVIEGKTISLEKALKIAKNRGYEIGTWEIDYEKKLGSNDYKTFFPRLIWTIKGQKNNSGIEVIQINAKNGNIIKEFQEYNID